MLAVGITQSVLPVTELVQDVVGRGGAGEPQSQRSGLVSDNDVHNVKVNCAAQGFVMKEPFHLEKEEYEM